ncbi:MAG: SMI1/KNR4 family protein [Methylococcaceae bacterium]|nr:SMI1/KNR4 family protein [Methylococcaceae bacterium]
MAKIVESEKNTTCKEIEQFEALIGQILPDDYKQFLLLHNGGTPKPAGFYFTLKDNQPEMAMVAWFLALYEGEDENITDDFYSFKDRIPNNMLAVARDPGGSLILLGLQGDNKGKVFFWLRELEAEDGEPATYDNVAFVANSFNEFLDSFIEVE